MITGRQIRAARALLGWDASDLAQKANLTRETISNIENGAVQARESTLNDIVRAFDKHGLEFTEHQGVRFKPNDIEVYEGAERFEDFYTFMYEHLENSGGEVCLSCVNERLFAKHRKNIEAHRERMKKMAESGRIHVRVMATESHFSAPWAEYRWQPEQSATPTAFYAFGNCLALISFDHVNPPYVVLHKSGPFAETYRSAFNSAWEKAAMPLEDKS